MKVMIKGKVREVPDSYARRMISQGSAAMLPGKEKKNAAGKNPEGRKDAVS